MNDTKLVDWELAERIGSRIAGEGPAGHPVASETLNFIAARDRAFGAFPPFEPGQLEIDRVPKSVTHKKVSEKN